MALTYDSANAIRLKADKKYLVITKVTLDNAYPANGWALDANALGVASIDNAWVLNPGVASYEYVGSTTKLKAYYGDYNNAADGLFLEIAVGDTAILDGVVIYICAIGS